MSAESDADALARSLRDSIGCDAVVLTLDREGALLLEGDGAPVRVATEARDVYDVTGAGDMVLAALCAGVANGMDWLDAVALANVAAGLEVAVFGVQPIPLEQLHREVLRGSDGVSRKVRRLEQAVIEVKAARRDGKRVVFTNGCFDVLHAGHIRLLRDARSNGDVLVVGVNADDSIRRLKGDSRPINALDDRLEVLSELESVDVLVPFEEDTPVNLLEALRPDVLCKGADYSEEQVVGADIVKEYGGSIVLIPVLEGRSSTRTIEKVGL